MNTTTALLPPDLLAATESLAGTLLHAEPIAVYHRAKARLDADPGARALLERLSVAQNDLRMRQANGGVTQAEADALRALQREVQSNYIILDYAQSQQAAVAYLREINQEISQLIGIDFGSLAKRTGCC